MIKGYHTNVTQHLRLGWPFPTALLKAFDFIEHISEKRGIIKLYVGPWRSLVARILGVDEVAGSNPVGPTNF